MRTLAQIERRLVRVSSELDDLMSEGIEAIEAMRDIVCLARRARKRKGDDPWTDVDARIAAYEEWNS